MTRKKQPKHRRQEPRPLVVRLGVMTNEEHGHLSIAERELVEDGTKDMLAKYGPEFFVLDRERLRTELAVCGFLAEPFVWWSPSMEREFQRRAQMNTSQEGLLRIYYSPTYCAANCDFDTTRKAGWIAESLRRHPISGVVLSEPAPLTVEQLLRVHDPAYVEAVRTGEPRWAAESNGLTWDAGLWEAVRASNGGAVAAALDAFETKRNAGSLSSGLHHASVASGSGFCTFNGLALAARALIDAGAKRVLVVDLDAHGGGGSMSIMKDWPEVLHIDIVVSEVDTYEVERGSRSSIDIVRRAADYLTVLRERLSALQDLQFDVLIYNAGMDPHQASLGGLAGITFTLLAERERLVFDWALTRQVPVAFVLAGGYSSRELTKEDLAGLHRQTLAAAARVNAGEPLSVHSIMDAAYAGPHRGTEGFSYDANGRRTDSGFHADLLGDEDDDPFGFDGHEFVKLSPKNRDRFIGERHSYPGRHADFMKQLLEEQGGAWRKDSQSDHK